MSSTKASPGVGFVGADMSSVQPQNAADQRWSLIAMVTSVAVLIAIYWNTFVHTKDFWNDETYSHGWIIPFIALFIMWSQRNPLGGAVSRDQENKNMLLIGVPLAIAAGFHIAAFQFSGLSDTLQGIGWLAYAVGIILGVYTVFRFHQFEEFSELHRWIGVGILVLATLIRVYGTYRDRLPVDRYSFIIALFGVFLMVGGGPLIRRMWASTLFFFFMMPLPSVVETNFLNFLQKLAAMASTIVLQVLGVIAHREGSRIYVDGLEHTLEVVGACAGMRMVTIFSAMVLAMVLIVQRPWWEKLILLISALPIAIITNVIRITVTALLFLAVEGTSWQAPLHDQIHDYAGYAMIFIAGGIMWLEYKVLSWLFIEETGESLQAVTVPGGIPTANR